MNPKRVGILLKKEFAQGSKSFIFIMAILTPIILSVVLSLLFGTLFSQKPKLGIVDRGTSRVVASIAESPSISLREYDSAPKLKKAVANGALDVGVVLPPEFDRYVVSGERTEVVAYVWGESLIKNRAIVEAVMAKQIRDIADQKPPVEILPEAIGGSEDMTWEERFFPLIVLIAIFMGGMMVPAVSLVDEKQKQTLKALLITPVSLGDVYLAKGVLGTILSLFMGVLILILNHTFGAQPALLLSVLSLGALLAATAGVLLGTLIKEVNSLYAVMKFTGLFIYAPALIYLFPQIPGWIGKVFPTYYVMAPIIQISRKNVAWSDISSDILILIGIILCMWSVIALKTKTATRRRFSAMSSEGLIKALRK